MSRKTLLKRLQDEYDMLATNYGRLNTFIISVKQDKVKSYNSLDKLLKQYDAMKAYRKALLARIEELYADENAEWSI